ncbi:sulfatase-like hydrolase/transferase [Haloarcula marina]|uniref:sulfatase-like hydrolase/transferase n=1 Tax=Haloarcula marina TaxID=2961574 RepID=UPI0020B8CBBB|nr:sulfatase-like hydrolase/transferase [Halomicroarcula marina]
MTNRQSIVWITLESIRYDHTSLSDYDRDTTPSLQRIADGTEGNSFDHCISHGNWTGTSSASILTGTTPPTHGIFGESSLVLSEDIETIPELLPEEMTTQSLVSNPNAGPARGLDRGFDDLRYVVPSRLRDDVGLWTMAKSTPQLWSHGGGLTADIDRHKGLTSYMTVDLAKRFVASQDDPYFMYLHLGSSHHPYLPPAAYLDAFTDELTISPQQALDIAQSRYEDIHELIADGGLSPDERQAVEAMYDAVISHVDYCVGELFDAIQRNSDDTIVVVTADHGDLLDEYDLAGHKFVLDDALIHVPLVTHGLDGVDHQTGEVVQHIDVLETALSQIGVESLQFEGSNLRTDSRTLAVTQRSGNNAQENLKQVREYDPKYELPIRHLQTATSFRSTEDKLVHSEDAVELFALPDEQTNLKDRHSEKYEEMLTEARRWLDEHETRPAAEREQELDSDIKDHLSDMGYLV